MRRFHLSYDIAEESNITILDVARFLCGDLQCQIVLHRVKSTFIFDSDLVIDSITMEIEKKFPKDFYYELTEVKDGICKGKANPIIKEDYREVCKMYRINSKINLNEN